LCSKKIIGADPDVAPQREEIGKTNSDEGGARNQGGPRARRVGIPKGIKKRLSGKVIVTLATYRRKGSKKKKSRKKTTEIKIEIYGGKEA